jgi:hypothetical protein
VKKTYSWIRIGEVGDILQIIFLALGGQEIIDAEEKNLGGRMSE